MADEDQKAKNKENGIKELELMGYKFTVDLDLLDDVEVFEIVDRIENKGQTAGIVELLKFLIGDQGYQDMKVYFTKYDADREAKEHPDKKDYKPRFRLTDMTKVYEVIVENFNPKG